VRWGAEEGDCWKKGSDSTIEPRVTEVTPERVLREELAFPGSASPQASKSVKKKEASEGEPQKSKVVVWGQLGGKKTREGKKDRHETASAE